MAHCTARSSWPRSLGASFAALVATAVTVAGAATACGSRSELDALGVPFSRADAAPDAPGMTGDDATADAPLPPIEAGRGPDGPLANCSSPSIDYIYLVTEQEHLWSYYPPTGGFTTIGTLACPASGGGTPFSMAVDRQGVAYVVYSSGELFRVSTKTAACERTAFAPPSTDFENFGMGFVGDANGAADTLYIATANTSASLLATLDVQSFQPSIVGPLSLQSAELTGTGDGRLFSFYSLDSNGENTAIAQIDPATAAVVANSNLTNLPRGDGWAFGMWGGDFYVFTAPGGTTSTVTRFRPSDGSQTTVGSLPEKIVGAGVSTCAPAM